MARTSSLILLAAALPLSSHAKDVERAMDAQNIDHAIDAQDLERTIDALSSDEQLAQLLVVGFSGTTTNAEVEQLVRDLRVGAIALFSRNVESPQQVRRLSKGIRELAGGGIPPFIAVDQEGGLVVRLKQGATVLPGNMALGATRSRTLAYLAGQALGTDLRWLGISMNLAPVLDVNSNPSNPVIGIRSFGERPELVSELGAWFIRGQADAGIVAVAKHFPGHGDTQSDSHYDVPSLGHDLARLHRLELVPFRSAFKMGLDAVMTAHIALPKIAEAPGLPATLSHRVLTDLLRVDLGFEGLVLTDGLEMRAIVEGEGIGRAAVKAILAGADMVMVLWSKNDRDEVVAALRAAYASGELGRERLRQSLRRIIALKHRRGVIGPSTAADPKAYTTQRLLHDQVAEEIAEQSITLVRDRRALVPLRGDGPPRRVLFLGPEGPLSQELAAQATVLMPLVPTRERRQRDALEAVARSGEVDLIVAAAQNRYHVEVIRSVRQAVPSVPMIFVSLASPYYLTLVPEVEAYVCAYGGLGSSQRATARVLKGERGTVGRLPVTIPPYYPYGAGIVAGASPTVGALPASGAAGGGASKKLARSPK